MSANIKHKFGGLSISEAQVDLLQTAEKFCRNKFPIEKVREFIPDAQGFDTDIWNEIAALGWTSIAIPDRYHGIGLTIGDTVPVMEMMGRALMYTPFLSTTLATQAILAGGDDAQKQDILSKIVKGSIATLALSEPQGDYELNNIHACAETSGQGYKLSGTKTFVMDLDVAEYVIVSAKIKGDVALFVLEAQTIPASHIRRETLIDETKRGYELKLDGLIVKDSARLPQDKVAATLHRLPLVANLLYAAEMVGGTKSVIDYTVEYLKTRKQFGRLIGSYQALKHPIVDAFVDYEKSRSLLYSAASCIDDSETGEVAVRMAKGHADKAFSFAADRAIQFHGGFGFTYDCDAQLYRRRAMFDASQFGDARYHKRKLAHVLFG